MKGKGIKNQSELGRKLNITRQAIHYTFFDRDGYHVYKSIYLDLCKLLKIEPGELIK